MCRVPFTFLPFHTLPPPSPFPPLPPGGATRVPSHRLKSVLELLALSTLTSIDELLLLHRRFLLVSLGSCGLRPECRANKFRTSVSDTTPDKRPDIRAPGRADADTDGQGGDTLLSGELETFCCVCGGERLEGGTRTAEASEGVGGADGDGELGSTTQSLLTIITL
jgi:hypothetical protein